jgi:NTP pyrophosphatase (non-canonical NTP hydrolase)
MLDLAKTQDELHHTAVSKGWWEEERTFGDIISLMHSELSEALEDFRNGKKYGEIYYEGKKPCGIPTELADCIIRILDFCGKNNIDIEDALIKKIEFNKTRPHRHGGKKL